MSANVASSMVSSVGRASPSPSGDVICVDVIVLRMLVGVAHGELSLITDVEVSGLIGCILTLKGRPCAETIEMRPPSSVSEVSNC